MEVYPELIADQLLSSSESERLEAIRLLGRGGHFLDLLETIALREEPTEETLSATFWLSLRSPKEDNTWLWRLGRSMLWLEKDNHELAEVACELHIIALKTKGLIEED
jgi:hypothetical protein